MHLCSGEVPCRRETTNASIIPMFVIIQVPRHLCHHAGHAAATTYSILHKRFLVEALEAGAEAVAFGGYAVLSSHRLSHEKDQANAAQIGHRRHKLLEDGLWSLVVVF